MESVTTYKFLRILCGFAYIGLFVSVIWDVLKGGANLPINLFLIFISVVFGLLWYLILSHDINKYSDWIKQAKEFPREDVGEVSHISQSSTKVNGRNLSVLSVKYKGYEVSFSGCDPGFAFKYRVGDAINIKVHETDDQRFVPAEFSKMK